jgi:peptide methionine sulfoxide reductase MsrA
MKATFTAGCLWHVEDLFRKVKGVTSAGVGYTGGWFENLLVKRYVQIKQAMLKQFR